MNIVIFSSVAWNFLWQRPQHIASKLADKGHNIVFFENPIFVNSAAIVKERIKERKFIDLRRVRSNLWVVTLYLPPFQGKFSALKDRFSKLYFDYCLRKIGFHPDAAIYYSLHLVSLIDTLDSMNSKIAFDFVDDIMSFPEFAFEEYLKMQSKLIDSSSVVFATSKLLCDKIGLHDSRCVYLPNAMDFDHFNRAADAAVKLDELPNLRHPVIGFIGAFLDWVDDDLVCKLAQAHPEYSILLVGPVNVGKDKLGKHSNIFMVGTKPYETLPQYLSNVDVCIIPFKINNITLASNPIKMYEYLASGKPVVSTALPEVLRNASEIVYVGRDYEDFVRKVELAVQESEARDESAIARRLAFARNNSWASRVDVIDGLLKEIVKN